MNLATGKDSEMHISQCVRDCVVSLENQFEGNFEFLFFPALAAFYELCFAERCQEIDF